MKIFPFCFGKFTLSVDFRSYFCRLFMKKVKKLLMRVERTVWAEARTDWQQRWSTISTPFAFAPSPPAFFPKCIFHIFQHLIYIYLMRFSRLPFSGNSFNTFPLLVVVTPFTPIRNQHFRSGVLFKIHAAWLRNSRYTVVVKFYVIFRSAVDTNGIFLPALFLHEWRSPLPLNMLIAVCLHASKMNQSRVKYKLWVDGYRFRGAIRSSYACHQFIYDGR